MRLLRTLIGKVVFRAAGLLLECLALPWLVLAACIGRFARKPIDVGLGPEPLINNVYHKRALVHEGYSAETFVIEVSFITADFDVRADRLIRNANRFFHAQRVIAAAYLFSRIVRRYKCIYIYFNGGPLSLATRMLGPLEPWLYKLAGVRIVVMPYGGDVHDLWLCPNLTFKHAMCSDYPWHHRRRKGTAARISRWTRMSDHVISGCDWVDYMYHWDTLMLGHFSIDTSVWTGTTQPDVEVRPLRILHAPNHRTIKGSSHFIRAVDELREEGVDVELVILERVGNEKVREAMASVDIVADQLIIGWYAMFALEAMSMGKAVLCYLRPDLIELYENTGLVVEGEIPIVSCTPRTVKEQIRQLAEDRSRLRELQKRGPEFVRRHHSIEAVGAIFAGINRSLGIAPQEVTSA